MPPPSLHPASEDPFRRARAAAIAACDASRSIRLRLKIEKIARRCTTEPPATREAATGILEQLLETVMECCDAPMANIQLFDEQSQVLRIRVQKGFDREFLLHFAEVRGATACDEAFRHSAPVVIEDVANSRVYNSVTRRAMLDAGALSVQSLGLKTGEQPRLGVISVHYRELKIPKARRDALASLSPQLAQVIATCADPGATRSRIKRAQK